MLQGSSCRCTIFRWSFQSIGLQVDFRELMFFLGGWLNSSIINFIGFQSVEWFLKEGDFFEPIKEIAKVKGKACSILLGERTALNIIARCSGIATRWTTIFILVKMQHQFEFKFENNKNFLFFFFSRSKKCIDLKKEHNFKGIIAGTRKTTPGIHNNNYDINYCQV